MSPGTVVSKTAVSAIRSLTLGRGRGRGGHAVGEASYQLPASRLRRAGHERSAALGNPLMHSGQTVATAGALQARGTRAGLTVDQPYFDPVVAAVNRDQIGRASCRER